MQTIELWRIFALGFVALGQSMFVGVYVTFPWFKTFLGRALFYKAVMLALLTDLFIAARVTPDYPNWDVIFLVVYILLGFGVWWQFFAFLRVRRAGRQNNVNPNERVERVEPVSGNVVQEL